MKLLVVSAHLDGPNCDLWRRLQWEFLQQNTKCDWDYLVLANGCDTSLFNHAMSVLYFDKVESHQKALSVLVEFFRHTDHTHLLVLDSDAWPVRDDWVEIADNIIGDRFYTAVMRTENYDDFPHPSACFIRRSFVDYIDFGFKARSNLYGQTISDVGTAMPQSVDGVMAWVPLLRTNKWNPHPVCFGVYGDLFYHHGAGSRGPRPGFRVIGTGVYSHVLKRQEHRKIYNQMTERLRKRSHNFIGQLRHGFENH